MNDKELGLDVFEMADDEEIKRIAADCPASPEEKERMFKLSQKIYNERTNESNEAHADEVSGVEQYKKPIWHKIVSAAAALALVAGLGAGGYMLARNKGADNHFASGENSQVQEAAESNYPFGSLENERVRMTCSAIAPAVVELTPEKVTELANLLEKLPWEEVEEEIEPDGERDLIFFYNNDDPYMLEVSADGTIRYYKNYRGAFEPRVYKSDGVLYRFLHTIELNPDEFIYDNYPQDLDDICTKVWIYEIANNGTEIELPNFTAMNIELTKEQLRDRGLNYQVKKVENTEIQPNYVIKTEPEAGTKLKQGDTVTLYVSLGADATGTVTVDDYVGKMVDDAAIMAGYREFSVLTYEVPSDEPQGTVVEQYPKAGDQALPKTVVYFFLSKGEYTAGEITYRFITPEGINGRYSIDIIWTNSDGKAETEGAGVVIEPEAPVVFERIAGEGSGLKATAVITNLNNDKKAELGHYIFDFDKGNYIIEDEDIEEAFEAIK
ncbi:PASTA domain-containing protein [uncultured Ruminococcus sp.]|uniref:PASTA domain-containing protein n=1 Tax=uncultured Ruminococcus sp. TaxID=165186 RepID=UPI0025E3DE54|nr:PASTA domain-containing protein [uncultured Ruminococcus sp.]